MYFKRENSHDIEYSKRDNDVTNNANYQASQQARKHFISTLYTKIIVNSKTTHSRNVKLIEHFNIIITKIINKK